MIPMELTQESLAKKLKLSRATINRLCTEKGYITPKTALRLSKALKTTPEFWLNMQNAYDLWVEEKKEKRVSITPIISSGIAAKRR